jgi:hypothetical protein
LRDVDLKSPADPKRRRNARKPALTIVANAIIATIARIISAKLAYTCIAACIVCLFYLTALDPNYRVRRI